MKNEDEKFDDLLRDRMDSMPDEFEEVYWVKAKKMIRAERQLKTNMFLYGLVLFVITGVIGGLGFYMNNYASGNENSIEESGIDNKILVNNEQQKGAEFISTNLNQNEDIKQVMYSKTEVIKQNVSVPIAAKKMNKERTTIILINDQDKKTKSDLTIINATVYPVAEPVQRTDMPESENKMNETEPETDFIETASSDIIFIEAKGIKQLKLNQLICDTCNPVRANFHKQFDHNQNSSFLALEACITGFNHNNISKQTLNYGFGMRYYYFIKPRLGVIVGLEYRRLNQDLQARNHYSSNYDFGSVHETKSIQTKQLDYLQIPLSFIYRFNARHMVNAGVNYMLLLQTTEQITTTQSGDQTLNLVTYEHGYFDAVNRNDIQLNLGYSFFINSKIVMHSNMYLGLLDISNNTLFKENKFDRNKGFTLGISYKIK